MTLENYRDNKEMIDLDDVLYNDQLDFASIIDGDLTLSNVFNELVEILTEEFNLKHSKGGRKPKLTIEEMLKATYDYFCSSYIVLDKPYFDVTYKLVAQKYGVLESKMYENINWVVDTLTSKGIMYDYINNEEGEEHWKEKRIDLTKLKVYKLYKPLVEMYRIKSAEESKLAKIRYEQAMNSFDD